MAIFKSLLAVTIALIATANAAPKLEARQITIANFVPMGCWSDDTGRRTLKQTTFTNSTSMTIENCTAFCQGGTTPFNLAGLENAQECWCSNAMDNGPSLIADGLCNQPCTGNKLQTCGGSNALNVFRNANIVIKL